MGAVHQRVKQAARDVAPWIERLARLGYFSRGVVYVVVAFIAGRAAFGDRSPAGARGAMLEIVRQPFGRVAIAVVAAGLMGYAIWRLVEAVLDPERKGTKLKGLGKRTAYLFTAVIYTGLAATALGLAFGGRSRGDQTSAGQWTAPVMAHPLGRWAVAAVGVVVAGYGCWLLYRSVAKEPEKRLDLSRFSEHARRAFKLAGRIGIAARAVVFGVVGIWLVKSALDFRPEEARMPTGALETVRQQPHGHWLLALIAVGLAGFGFFEMVKARYRHITAA